MKNIILVFSLAGLIAMASDAVSAKVEYQEGLLSQSYGDMQGEHLGDKNGPWRAALGKDPNGGSHATMWRTKPGFNSGVHRHTSTYHAVVLEGEIENTYPGQGKPVRLKKGGYFTVLAGSPHITRCVSKSSCAFFSVMDKPFDFLPENSK